MSTEPKRVELTKAERVRILAVSAYRTKLMREVETIITAREAAAREEGANETFQGLKHRAEKVEAKVARVEALAEDWARDRIGGQSLALTYQFAAEKLRAALAEPERDEEGSDV